MKTLFYYIPKTKLLLMLILITLKQGLTAFSTYALAKAGFAFEDRMLFISWVVFSLGLYLLTPALDIFIRRLEVSLGFEAYNVFLKDSLFSKFGVSSFWQNKTEKDRFLASIGSDASDYLSLLLFLTMDLYSFSLSIVLGVLVLSFTIDMSLLPAFIVAGVISFVLYRKVSPLVETRYNADQLARTELGGHLLKSWDNVLLKNESVLNKYRGHFENKINQAEKKAVKASMAAESLVFALGLVTGIPVLISVCWILLNPSANAGSDVFVALLATLPRQLNILGVFRSIFQSLTSLLSVRVKFDVICAGTSLTERDLSLSIKVSEITLNKKYIANVEILAEQVSATSRGRYEVRGPNGSGKSTLLLHLNENLKSSFYLPTHPDLFLDANPLARSSGENLFHHLDALKDIPEQIILLDEWDANLDAKNLAILNEKIQTLSQTKTILEVRHRTDTISSVAIQG